MFTKEQIWNSIAHEMHVIKHLAGKIPAGREHHKPTEKQRTTLELLQYLSYFGKGSLTNFLEGNYNASISLAESAKSVTVSNFSEAIDKEEKEMKVLWEKFTEEEMSKELDLWGRKQAKGLFLLDFTKMLAAYKMQLFLYVKQSGNHAISTSNVWAGMDMPARV